MRAIRRISDALVRRPDLVFWLIATYYVLAVMLRVVRSEAPQSDEAEQMFESQLWLLGYGRQPPLYTWLQAGVNALIGPSVLALSLVKNALLFLTCLFYGLTARLLLKDARLPAAAMLGILAMPVISILSQRDLTHAVATLFSIALFFYAFLKTLARPSLGSYLLTGFAVGIGLISKYNFVIAPVAAIIAILPEPEFRRRLFDWRIVAALLVAAVICLPHGLWMLSNLTTATEGTIARMREDSSGNALTDRISGVGMLLTATLGVALPVLLLFLFAFRRSMIGAIRVTNPWARVIGRTIVLCLVMVGLVGLAFGATTVNGKWLSPFLLLLPLYVCLKLDAIGVESGVALPRLFFPVAAVALGFLAYLPASNLAAPYLGHYEKENFPGRPFVEKVVADHGGARPAWVIADSPALAANARLELPDTRVVVPRLDHGVALEEAAALKPGLVIWQIGKGNESSDAMPAGLADYLAANGFNTIGAAPARMAVPYLFSAGRASVTFGYAWLAGKTAP